MLFFKGTTVPKSKYGTRGGWILQGGLFAIWVMHRLARLTPGRGEQVLRPRQLGFLHRMWSPPPSSSTTSSETQWSETPLRKATVLSCMLE